MAKNTDITPGNHFDGFITHQIAEDREHRPTKWLELAGEYLI